MPYASYRLTNTYLARVGNAGGFEYKSVADLSGQSSDTGPTSFLEWSVGGLHQVDNGMQARSFRFGARIPIKVSAPGVDPGRPGEGIVYEAIGLSLDKLGIAENVPTLIGTLMLPRPNATLFLIATITRVDR